jgi:cell wall assembly regulator SMI1
MIDEITTKCETALGKLHGFSDELLHLGEPITDNRLGEFEAHIGFRLPLDFKYILTKHNSFSLSGTEVLGIDEQFKGSSLAEVYHFEHEEGGNPMFKEYLPFSPDGRGNHYCLDLTRLENDVCPVVFWQHDVLYSDKSEVETCNDSFIAWMDEVVIEWAIEEMNQNDSSQA